MLCLSVSEFANSSDLGEFWTTLECTELEEILPALLETTHDLSTIQWRDLGSKGEGVPQEV